MCRRCNIPGFGKLVIPEVPGSKTGTSGFTLLSGQSTNHGAPHVTTAAGQPRTTCRPSSRAVPPSHSSPRPLKQAGALSLQTLVPVPPSTIDAGPSSAVAVDSSSLVGLFSIPRVGSFSSLSSTRSPPHPALSLAVQARRRAPSPAAAVCRRATPSLLLSACALAGELRLALERAVRAFSCSFRPHLTIPPLAVTAVSRRPRAAHVWAMYG